jgi:sulfite reductase (NADPH) flavoprotein alpha-component
MSGDRTTVRTACSYCGVGCGMVLEVGADPGTGRRRVLKVQGDKAHPANRGRLCTKGATSADMLAAGGRLHTALVRPGRGAQPVETPVDRAVGEAARRLRAVLDEHGPDAVAMYVSGQLSLEAQYLANKLTKGYLRSRWIESNSRLCMASAGTGYKQSLGADGPPGSYDDFDAADVFLVIGANMADCHPILFLRMMDRVRQGAKLIVVDPRRTATAAKADLFLQVNPGTDLALLNGLLHLVVAGGQLDEEFVGAHTSGWEDMPELLADYPPDVVAGLTAIAEDDLRTAAAWIGGAGEFMSCWTMGLNQSTHGTWHTNALCNLHLATGTICRTGSGPFSLTGQPNAMGGREMGYMGPGLPGQRSVLDPDDREFVEREWGLPAGTLGTGVSTGTVDMFRRMAGGEIKACWILGTNPVASVANRRTVIEGLEAAELVITQDVFAETETNAYADIVLPATLWAESEYVAVNSERTLTLLPQAVEPDGEALPDWRIISRIAAELGFTEGFGHASAAEVFDEIRRFANPRTGYDLRGVDHERLRESPVQWPSPPGDLTGRHPVRYRNDGVSQPLLTHPDGSLPALRFATPDGRARFLPRPYLPPAELPDDERPFLLNTGRLPHQWHTMTKTGKVAALRKLNPDPFVEVHPADAERLGIGDGDRVEVASRRGRAVLPASVTDRVRPGCCFAPFHWNDAFGEYLAVNAVTSDAVDPDSLQPEFKACAVALTRVGPAATRQPAATPEPGATPGPVPATAARGPAGEGRSVDGLAERLGLGGPPVVPELTGAQAGYLRGFLWALRDRDAPGGPPVLPGSAPFDAATRAWLDGALAGWSAAAATTSTPEGPEDEPAEVLLLWASQTGNAEDQAGALAERLRADGVPVHAAGMDDCPVERLRGAAAVLVVSSTYGDGDAPDNGQAFWSALTAPDAPALDGVRFAVLAFGDSSYDDFCGHGRRLDDRLAELGGVRITERADREPGDTELPEHWLTPVRAALGQQPPARTTPREPERESPAPDTAAHGRSNPLHTRLLDNEPLSGDGSSKEVRRVALALDGLDYRAGDTLGVWPTNEPGAVAQWLAATGLDGETPVTLEGEPEMPLRQAAEAHLEILAITPGLLRFVRGRAGSRELDTLLRPGNTTNLRRWTWGRQSLDLLTEFPVRAAADDWLAALSRLRPRMYSISSSPAHAPDRVELTVSAVRYQHRGHTRHGVCSTFLADRADTGVPVFVQPTRHFRPPADPDTPMIMIGPGTGIAPFRAFLQDRRALGHTGRNWLFFGERNSASDFHYRDELQRMHADGLLTRLDTVFSRDQRQKRYVQDLMREHATALWSWLNEGAVLYVCGDASRMAKDVDATLHDIVRQQGRLDAEAAQEWVAALSAGRRYLRDVY